VLREYLHNFLFRLVDTRGFFHFNSIRPLVEVLNGTVKEGDVIRVDNQAQIEEDIESPGSISDQINAVIFCVSGVDIRLLNQGYREHFGMHRRYLRSNGITTITLVTHNDEIDPGQQGTILAEASTVTGSPIDKTFFISNYTRDCPSDLVVEETVIKVLKHALTSAESTIRIKMMKERHSLSQVSHNYDITIICGVQGYNGRADFTISVRETVSGLMEIIKRTFGVENSKDFYFTTVQGKILSEAVDLREALGGRHELLLNKYLR